MRKLINVDVLIIDDFLTMSINLRGQEDFTKIVIERDGRLPTIIDSQSTAAYWVQTMPNRIAAESLVSRFNTGLRIDIGDYDIRKALSPPPPNSPPHKPAHPGAGPVPTTQKPPVPPTQNTGTNQPASAYRLGGYRVLGVRVLGTGGSWVGSLWLTATRSSPH